MQSPNLNQLNEPVGRFLVDGGFLCWTYGVSIDKLGGWAQIKFKYFKDKGGIIILDSSSKLLREEYYADYKSERRERTASDPERMKRREQVKWFISEIIIPDHNLEVWRFDGLEADDVIGAFCFRNDIGPLRVIGTDKDLVQLGPEKIALEKHDGTYITFQKYFSTMPKTLIPFMNNRTHLLLSLALLGDKSDSIPRLVSPGVRSLREFARLLQAPHPLGLAKQVFGEAFLRNLYLAVLPSPWVFKEKPDEERVYHELYTENNFKGFHLREDLEAAYQKDLEGFIIPIKDTFKTDEKEILFW